MSAINIICEKSHADGFEEEIEDWQVDETEQEEHAGTEVEGEHCVEGHDGFRLAMKLLAHGGWRPELDRCIECGDADVSWISVAAGGVLCESCAHGAEGAEPVSPNQIGWLKTLINATFDELLAAEIDDATSTWIASFVHVWTATHLDARLKSWEFMLSV